MESSRTRLGSRAGDARGANARWKGGWDGVLCWSIAAAAALHLAIVATWPQYEIAEAERDDRAAPAQLVRLASSHVSADMFQGSTLSARELVAEFEAPKPKGRDDVNQASSDALDDLLANLPTPGVATSSLVATGGAPPLVAARAAEIAPPVRVAANALEVQQGSFSWPEILNPRQMIRFFRSRYNPLHTPVEGERYVSVAIRIDERGTVAWSDVEESSGHEVFDRIALAAVNEVLKFSPASSHGVPVSVSVVISFPFQVQW